MCHRLLVLVHAGLEDLPGCNIEHLSVWVTTLLVKFEAAADHLLLGFKERPKELEECLLFLTGDELVEDGVVGSVVGDQRLIQRWLWDLVSHVLS